MSGEGAIPAAPRSRVEEEADWAGLSAWAVRFECVKLTFVRHDGEAAIKLAGQLADFVLNGPGQ